MRIRCRFFTSYPNPNPDALSGWLVASASPPSLLSPPRHLALLLLPDPDPKTLSPTLTLTLKP